MWRDCRRKRWRRTSIVPRQRCGPTSPMRAPKWSGTWKEGSGRSMKRHNRHPNQATLALHAGGDLGRFAAWRTSRHVAGCEECREEVAAFQGLREILPELNEIPD